MTSDDTTGRPDTQPVTSRFPSAFTVLLIVTLAVWLLAFVIPSGRYAVDPEGRPIAGTYQRVPADLSFGDRLYELFLAPVNGLYGIRSAETGYVGPDEVGELFGAASVFLFVLAIGMFITMTMRSGALDAVIARIAERYGGRGVPLIIILMAIFSLGGTTYGMAEETLGFYGLIVPLLLSLKYDRLVGAAVILLGAGSGTMGSTVNPFATGVASGVAEIGIVDGLGLRLILYVVLTAIAIAYVLRYANRVRTRPETSLVGVGAAGRSAVGSQQAPGAAAGPAQAPELTPRRRAVLGLVGLTFAFMIFAIVPWSQIFRGPDSEPFPWELGWYFPELAALFIVMAVVVGIVAGMREKELTGTLVSGAGDFLGAALIIVLARGITVIMNNATIIDTVLNGLEIAIAGTSAGLFGALMFIFNIPLAFLVPSSSGHATLAMPILAPLGDFAGVSGSLVVTAYQSASGWVNLFTPTSAVVMGGLALAGVPYDRYLKFVWPLLVVLLVVTTAIIAIAATFGFG
jgi:uncharacterized ion transporter superfamily protein YfcC